MSASIRSLVLGIVSLVSCLPASPTRAEEPPPFLVEWGHFGTGPGEFNRTADVAAGISGTIYVADFVNSRIQRFASDGTFLDTWPTPPVGNAAVLPRSIALDSSDNVFVVDQPNSRILAYTAAGALLTTWGSFGTADGQFRYPSGIAVGSDDHVYVADSNNFRVQEFTGSGLHVRSIGSFSVPSVQLGLLGGVAVDQQGNIFTSELNLDRVTKISPGGSLVSRWGTTGSTGGQFDSPGDLCVDPAGNVYVLDQIFPSFEPSNHRAQKFTNDGAFLSDWGGLGNAAGEFNDPHGIAADGLGGIYVADTFNDRVQKFGIDAPVEVAVRDLQAVLVGSSVEVRWRAALTRNASFEIWRSEDPSGVFERIGAMEAQRGERAFSFTDTGLRSGTSYSYKVGYREHAGWTFTAAIRIVVNPAVAWLATGSNPARGSVRIEYSAGRDETARLEIFDVSGSRLRCLVDGRVATGAASTAWNGRDDRGRSVPAGRYFVRLMTSGDSTTRSIVLLR
jgi:sugar lactone lactonase YvrE